MEVKSSDFSDVFVSYRRKDVEFTKQLVEELQKAGKECWIDWEDIPPGSVGFSDDIKRGLEGADAFIAILTPDYLESPYCMDLELKYAVELKKKLIPIVLKKFDGYDIPADISHINWVYFTPHAGHENTFDESLPKVMQALDTDLEHVRTHKRLLLRALEWDANERKNSYLLRGNVLTEAEAWLAAAPDKIPDPTELHTQFIYESRKAAAAQQRQLLMIASVAAVFMAFLAVFAGFQWRAAELNKQEALTQKGIAEENAITAQNNADESRSLALAANAQLNLNSNNLDLAVALALEGSFIDQAPQDTILVLDEAAYLPGTRFLLEGHEGRVSAVALHPDQQHILSGGEDTKIIMWDITTGEMLSELTGHEVPILSIVFNNEGDIAASADSDGTVIVWDTVAGTEIRRFEEEHDAANVIIFAPDDNSLIVGYADGIVDRYDIESGDLIWQQTDHANAVTALDISPDGTQFIAGEGRGSTDNPTALLISDLETGEVLSTTTEVGVRVNDIAYTADGETVLLALAQSTLIEWSLADNTIADEFEGHRALLFGVDVSADGRYAVSVSDDTIARLWSIDGRRQDLWSFSGHVRAVTDLVITNDGKTLVTSSGDATLRVWDIENGAVEQTMTGHTWNVANVDFGADDNEGYSASWDEQVIRRNLETGETSLVFEDHEQFTTGLDYNPATGTVITSGGSNELLVWNPETNDIIYRLDAAHTGQWITNAVMTHDGQQAVSVDNSGGIGFWNLEDGTLLSSQQVEAGIRDVAISADDEQVVIGTADGQIILFNLATQTETTRWTIAGSPTAWSVALVPNSNNIAVGQSNNRISLFDSTGNLIRTFNGHAGEVNSIAISEDGTLLVSGSADFSLRLWDIETGLELRRLNMNERVISVSLNSDASQALVGLANNGLTLLVNIQQQDKEDLLQWVENNRYITDFTCLQREFYRLGIGACSE